MDNFKIRLLVAPFMVVGGLWVHELVQVQSEPLFIVDNALRCFNIRSAMATPIDKARNSP